VSGVGQAYELKIGDKYSERGADGSWTTKTVDERLLLTTASAFGLYSNISFLGYHFKPVDVQSIVLLPEYAENAEETIENIVDVVVLLLSKFDIYELQFDDDGNPIVDEDGYYVWEIAHYTSGDEARDVFDGYVYDYTEFADFGVIDPFYRVSGLKDVAYLYEVVDGQIVGLFDGELTAETSESVYLRTNVLEGEVELTSANEDLVTVTYDPTTGIHTLTADEFAGNTVLNATVGDEALAQFGVEVKISLYEIAGTYELDDGVENHTLVVTGNETDGYTITFDGNPCNLVSRDDNVVTFICGSLEVILHLTGDGVGTLFIHELEL
jgi:hypothetical protein